jgi:hypothetical protein
MGAIMKSKQPFGQDATTAASLVRHLSTKVAEDDLESVVSLLSDALDLAKAKLDDARKMRQLVDGASEPNYWIG